MLSVTRVGHWDKPEKAGQQTQNKRFYIAQVRRPMMLIEKRTTVGCSPFVYHEVMAVVEAILPRLFVCSFI